MLDGSALLRVFLVLVAAAVLTGLVQHYWTFENVQPETPAMAARLSGPAAPPRRPDPVPSKPPAQAAAPSPPPASPVQAPVQAIDAAPAPAAAAPMVAPPPRAAAPQRAVPPPPEPTQAALGEADEARAVDLVDLNTASLSELNGLKGGGSIGRAIVQHRPYTSTDQLLSKRVLSRAIYQRIRGQVTVR